MTPASTPLSTHLQRLKSTIPLLLSKTDAQIAHISRLLSTTSNVDTTLLTLTYTLHLLHALLHRLTTRALARSATALIASLPDSSPSTDPATLLQKLTTAPPARLLRATTSTAALAGLIDDFRIFLRLWGLVGIWRWGAATARAPPPDAVVRNITWAQVGVNAAYQVLENGAYLGSKGVVGLGERGVARWYVWSSRFWAAHVGLEFLRLARVRTLRLREREGVALVEGEEKEGKMLRAKEEAAWWSQVYVNAAWAPLTVHWSMESGFAGEAHVAALGLVAGVFGLKQAWKATA